MKNVRNPRSPVRRSQTTRGSSVWKACWWGMIFMAASEFCSPAQTNNLADYLPYSSATTSTFSSAIGFNLTIVGDSATDFHWEATHPLFEGSRNNYRLNGSGLSLLSEFGIAPGGGGLVWTQNYSPAWVVAPPAVTNGQSVSSSASYSGNEGFDTWTGSSSGTLSMGGFESVTTPAGTFDALKATFVSSWSETGTGYTASGNTTQIWWMAKSLGVVQLEYDFDEVYTENGGVPEPDSGELVFELTSSTLFANQPELSISLVNGDNARLEWDSIPGLSYQLQTSTNPPSWFDAAPPPISGTGDPLSADVPLEAGSHSFRLKIDRE